MRLQLSQDRSIGSGIGYRPVGSASHKNTVEFSEPQPSKIRIAGPVLGNRIVKQVNFGVAHMTDLLRVFTGASQWKEQDHEPPNRTTSTG